MTIGRIRVLVAGDIYVNRSLVRPFLEDDCKGCVGEFGRLWERFVTHSRKLL